MKHQRKGVESNAAAGRAFEKIAQTVLADRGINVDLGHTVQIGVGAVKKDRHYDLGSADPAVLVECKSYKVSENNFGARSLRLEREMYCFHIAPAEYRKILFVERSTRDGYDESFAERFVRLKRHFIPDDVEIWEYDHATKSVRVLPEKT